MAGIRAVWQRAKASIRVRDLDKDVGFKDDFGPSLDKIESELLELKKQFVALQTSANALKRYAGTLCTTVDQIENRITASLRNADATTKKDAGKLRTALADVKVAMLQSVAQIEDQRATLAAQSGAMAGNRAADFSIR
jgi:uncharacterized protein (DUF342 family)